MRLNAGGQHQPPAPESPARPVIVATDRAGVRHFVAAVTDRSLMVNLKYEGGLDIAADCGGDCFCGTCHVYVDDNWLDLLPSRSDEESELLAELLYTKETSRLACQIDVGPGLDGLEVTLAPKE